VRIAVRDLDKVYGGKRPRYLDGYRQLKAAIKPWGAS